MTFGCMVRYFRSQKQFLNLLISEVCKADKNIRQRTDENSVSLVQDYSAPLLFTVNSQG